MSDQSSPNGSPQHDPSEERPPTGPDRDASRPANPDDAFFAYSRQRREGRPPAFEQLSNYPPLEPPRIDDVASGDSARAAAEDAVRRLRESRRWRESAADDVNANGPLNRQPDEARIDERQGSQSAAAEQPPSPFDGLPFERSASAPPPNDPAPVRSPARSQDERARPDSSRLAELLDGSTVGNPGSNTGSSTGAQRNGSNSTLPPSTLPPSPSSPPPTRGSASGEAVADGITRKPQRDATEIAERIVSRMRHERGDGGEAAPSQRAPLHAINIRGRADGVSVELGKGEWSQMMRALTARLEEAADFFRGGRVSLDVGGRPMLEEELLQVRSLLAQHGMVLGNVRSTSERTCQSALTLGMATVLESPNGGADDVLAQPAESNFSGVSHYVYRGNLRSGQVLQLTDSIFLLGDVNPGAQVVSAGDIFIWGRLRGIAHAGVTGDEQSVVAALDLDPTQLRIASHIAIAPEPQPEHTGRWLWKQRVHKRPEVARVAEGGVVVEPWDMLRRGGLAATRR